MFFRSKFPYSSKKNNSSLRSRHERISIDSPLAEARRGLLHPDDVAASLVGWALRSHTDRLLDPSCGDGRFLALHRNSVGIEQDVQSAGDAIGRAPWALIHEGDFFTWAAQTTERFECAAGNPPFIRYQTFKGGMRQRALDLCAKHGANFSGLSSSWAPFLVATAALLSKGGRMAFVVPAEIGHAPYSAPLLEFLVSSFSEVRIIAVREKLFPNLSEDCWLLYADGFGGRTNHIDFTVAERFKPSRRPPATDVKIDIEEWRSVWNCRLRPYLLPKSTRELYRSAVADPHSHRFSEFAKVGIGYVSGDNDFFHLRPSTAARLKIPDAYLFPSVRNARALPNAQITAATVNAWKQKDDPMLLLRLGKRQELPVSVRKYLDSTAGKQARLGYKCRNRDPWYSVPDVQNPDYVLNYMSGRTVNLVRNTAGVTCTNSVHAVRIRDAERAAKLLPQWSSPFVRLSCEVEGHALGGGMLKVEPREAANILFPASSLVETFPAEAFEEALSTMQKWRHYAG